MTDNTVKGNTVKNTKKVLLATLAAGSMLALAACSGGSGGGSGDGGGDGGLIGVAMPTKSSERWIQDGDAVKEQLEEQGFTVDLQYAEDDIPTQVSQIENMSILGIGIEWQQVVKGLVLLLAVAFDVYNRRRSGS